MIPGFGFRRKPRLRSVPEAATGRAQASGARRGCCPPVLALVCLLHWPLGARATGEPGNAPSDISPFAPHRMHRLANLNVAPAPVRPEPAAVMRVFDQAYAAYADAQWELALQRFQSLSVWMPENPHVWLRLGNLHQRRGDWLAAAVAYRRAALLWQPFPVERPLQRLALRNLASVSLAIADEAIGQADALSGESPPVPVQR